MSKADTEYAKLVQRVRALQAQLPTLDDSVELRTINLLAMIDAQCGQGDTYQALAQRYKVPYVEEYHQQVQRWVQQLNAHNTAMDALDQ